MFKIKPIFSSSIIMLIACLFMLPYLSAQHDLEKIHALATKHLETGSYDSAVHYFHIQDSVSWAERDTSMIRDSKSFFVQHYRIKGNYLKSISYCEDLFKHINTRLDSFVTCNMCASAYQKTNGKIADSLYRLGISLSDGADDNDQEVLSLYGNYASFLRLKGNYTEAIDYYLHVVDHQQSPLPKVHAYLSLTKIYRLTDNIERAREMMDEAILISDENGYSIRKTDVAYTNATILWREKKYEDALLELNISIAAFKNKRMNSFVRAMGTRAKIKMDMNDWSGAASDLKFIEKDIANINKDGQVSVNLTKAKLKLHDGEYVSAISLANDALLILQEIEGETDRLTAYKILHRANAALGNKAEAYDYLRIKESLADSLYRVGQSQRIAQLESLHKRKEQHQEIASLLTQDEMKTQVVANQKRTLIIAGVGLFLISFLCLFLYRLYLKVMDQRKVISKALAEKDLLLREIHHRVKNNLQMVSSLLTMQGRSIDDEVVKSAINDGKNRVRSMSLIHQDLYSQENLTDINVKTYIEKLTTELFDTYQLDSQNVALEMNIESLDLDVDIMIPLGLIINELITNSLKYAFPDNRRGILKVELIQNKKAIHLVIADNGVGYNQDQVREDSFGSTLVSGLTAQLDGSVEVIANNGTTITIIIPNEVAV